MFVDGRDCRGLAAEGFDRATCEASLFTAFDGVVLAASCAVTLSLAMALEASGVGTAFDEVSLWANLAAVLT